MGSRGIEDCQRKQATNNISACVPSKIDACVYRLTGVPGELKSGMDVGASSTLSYFFIRKLWRFHFTSLLPFAFFLVAVVFVFFASGFRVVLAKFGVEKQTVKRKASRENREKQKPERAKRKAFRFTLFQVHVRSSQVSPTPTVHSTQ